MKTSPILFSTPMVQAILAERKTQTRRVMKPQSQYGITDSCIQPDGAIWAETDAEGRCTCRGVKVPYQLWQILWVREAWSYSDDLDNPFDYKADFELEYNQEYLDFIKGSWKRSIHMPKTACRLFLRITGIRVERLNDISEEDAKAEGVSSHDESPYIHKSWVDYANKNTHLFSAKDSFQTLWESINGKGSWEVNPWVWVIEFEQCEKPETFI